MNSEELLAMFSLTGPDKTLVADITDKDGNHWLKSVPVTVEPTTAFVDTKLPTITIVPIGTQAGFHTNWPVDSAETIDGRLALRGPRGIALFHVVDTPK